MGSKVIYGHKGKNVIFNTIRVAFTVYSFSLTLEEAVTAAELGT